MARLLLRAEAVGSSYIEGLQVNARRLAREEFAERAGTPHKPTTPPGGVGNIRAMGCALELADLERPISLEDLCTLHRELLVGTRDQHWGGVVRQEQNWIGGVNPCRAAYVPPPHGHVHGLLEDLSAYMSGDDHPPIVQAALAHAQFETIHPFVDGNGRVGRALIHLVLRRRGLAPNFVPTVSLILATNAGAYIAGLVSFRYDAPADDPVAAGAAIQWIDVFVNALLRACADASAFADQLDELEERWREAVSPVRRSSAVDLLLSALPGLPILTVETAAEAIGRSRKRTNDAVNHLHERGVLRQGTIGRRNRVFEVADLLDAITQFRTPSRVASFRYSNRATCSRRPTAQPTHGIGLNGSQLPTVRTRTRRPDRVRGIRAACGHGLESAELSSSSMSSATVSSSRGMACA